MKNIFTVSLFTIKETIQKKSFIISNILIIIIIFIIFSILQSQIDKFAFNVKEETNENITLEDNQVSQEETALQNETIDNSNSSTQYLVPIIAFTDSSNLVNEYLEDISDPHFAIELKPNFSIDELNELVNKKEVYSAVYIYTKNNIPTFKYLVPEYSSTNSNYASYISETIQKAYLTKLLNDANVSYDVIEKALSNIDYEIEIIEKENITDSSVAIGMFVSFILFFSIYMFGHNISASIASEKNSRVIETLVTSTLPSRIVIGKTLGMGILGLIQLIVISITTFICYKTFIPANLNIIEILLPNINISTTTIILLFVYFVLGYTLYAFLNAITGATVSKPEDIQAANLPVSFITMISFYLSFFAITLGSENKLSLFTSMFPLSSPFFMPSRIIANLATTGEIWASIGLLIVVTTIFSFISIRIYSIAILHYGNRLKFKDLFNIFLRIK